MTTLQVLEEQKSRVNPNVYLGRLLWYSITDDTMVEHAPMIAQLKAAGFTKDLPGEPRDYNVFARVTTAAKRSIQRPGTDLHENWLIRDVAGRAENVITRRVVLELRDPRGKKLDYHPIADIEFDRQKSSIAFTFRPETTEYIDSLEPEDAFRVMNTAKDIDTEIRHEYKRWRGKLNHYAVRMWIRDTILDMGGIAAKPSGGIYFLREEFAKDVDALVDVVGALGFGNECHALPLIDDRKQREMLKRAVEADTRGAIEQLMVEIKDVKKEGKLTPKKFEQILIQGKRLRRKTDDYKKLLEVELGEIGSSLSILSTMTLSLSSLQARRTNSARPTPEVD